MKSFSQCLAESRIFIALMEDLDDLRAYVHQDGAQKYSVQRDLPMLVKRYPFKGGTLYRGLNFDSPQEYLAFRRATRGGYFVTQSMSSWSPHYGTANDFARNKKAYIPTMDVMMAYQKMERTAERMMGFIGVTVEIAVAPGVGADVTQTGVAAEDEVLLPAGSYKIVQVHTEKRFANMLKGIDYNDTVIRWAQSGKNSTPEVDWIIANKGDMLYPDTVKMLATKAGDEVALTLHIYSQAEPWSKYDLFSSDARKHLFTKGKFELSANFKAPTLDNALKLKADVKLSSKAQATIINKLNAATKGLTADQQLMISNSHTLDWLMKQAGIGWTSVPNARAYFSSVYKNHDTVYRRLMKEDPRALRDLPKLLADVLKFAGMGGR